MRDNDTSVSKIRSSVLSHYSSSTTSSTSTRKIPGEHPQHGRKEECDDRFLQQIEETIDNVVNHYHATYNVNLLDKKVDDSCRSFENIPPSNREVMNIVRSLDDRIQVMTKQNICRRCWYPNSKKYCICDRLVPHLLPNYISTIYILTHYKEIGMMVDTMKLLLCTYPVACQLVVGGIDGQYQPSMHRMIQTLSPNNSNAKTLVLFPSSNAITFPTFYQQQQQLRQQQQQLEMVHNGSGRECGGDIAIDAVDSISSPAAIRYNIIVIDATWEQARRLYNRHIVPKPSSTSSSSILNSYTNIQLSDTSLQSLHLKRQETTVPSQQQQHQQQQQRPTQFSGKQLRPHPISVREIATAHAVQLLLHDMITTIADPPERPLKEESLPFPRNSNNTHNDKARKPKFSLQLHNEQQQMFDQYQQMALDTSLEIKSQWGK